MVDAVGTTQYTYYAGGLLQSEDGPWSSDTVTYAYNTARLRSSLSLQQPTGTWTNGFTWDAAVRLSTASSPAGTFAYSYRDSQPSTLIKKLSLPNTSYITNTYDNFARLTGTYLDDSSNTVLDKSEYLYNAGNQRIRHTRTDASYYTNTYDNIGQLKWADSTVSSEDRGYLYDAAWNLNQRTNNGATSTFTVDSKNQLSSEPGLTDQYDSNGNLTARYDGGTNTAYNYSYDAENQLTSAQYQSSYAPTSSWWRAEFQYDGRGRLRQRAEYVAYWGPEGGWYPNGTTRYVYDGMRVIQERNSGNTPMVSYTRGNDLSGTWEGAGGIGGLLARSHGYSSGSWTNHNFYHADGNGNITYMVNTNQSMVASYRYDPFGNTISSSGAQADANLYRFSSKEFHVNSGMYYYGYRWYDPNLQRWLNRDPLGESGGINLYCSAGNDPTAYIDRDGLDRVSTTGKSVAQAGSPPITNDPGGGGVIKPVGPGHMGHGGMNGNWNNQLGRPKPGVPTGETGCETDSDVGKVKNKQYSDERCPCTNVPRLCIRWEVCQVISKLFGTSYYGWVPTEKCSKCPEY